MDNMYQLAFDLTQYGCGDLVPLQTWELRSVWPHAQALVDQYDAEVCGHYVAAQQQELLQQYQQWPQATADWKTCVLLNIAMAGQLGLPIPDCIDLED